MSVNLTSENLKILICCHKPCGLPANPDGIFLPIYCGAAHRNQEEVSAQVQQWRKAYGGGVRDDLLNGEPCCNISAKDQTYSEMTAPYWAWKNIKALYPRLEYIGVNHYRRYFSFEGAVPFYHCIKKPEAAAAQYKLNLGKLESILSKHDIVMAKPIRFPYSVATQYAACHPCLQVLRKVVHSKYPEYDREMYNALDRSNRMSLCNLCIMKWDDFDAYCTWAFDILFEIEKQTIDDGNYGILAKRLLGYMAERLFNVWVLHRGLKVKHLPFVLYNGEQNSRALYNALECARYSLSFFFVKPVHKFSPQRYATLNRLDKG